jgi:hypothetical protein
MNSLTESLETLDCSRPYGGCPMHGIAERLAQNGLSRMSYTEPELRPSDESITRWPERKSTSSLEIARQPQRLLGEFAPLREASSADQ